MVDKAEMSSKLLEVAGEKGGGAQKKSRK